MIAGFDKLIATDFAHPMSSRLGCPTTMALSCGTGTPPTTVARAAGGGFRYRHWSTLAAVVGILASSPALYGVSPVRPWDPGQPGVVPPVVPPDTSCRPVLAYQMHAVRAVVVSGFDGTPWLRVSAKAWAPHPGYRKPRLIARKHCPTDPLLRLRFLLDPPRRQNVAWPAVLSEVEAVVLLPLANLQRVAVRGRHGRVVRRINPDAPVFPCAWGPPPGLQTKDWRPLPAQYGYGSSTLAGWIRDRLSKK